MNIFNEIRFEKKIKSINYINNFKITKNNTRSPELDAV